VGNVIVLRLLVLFAIPSEVIIFMAVLAFASGVVVGVFSLRVNELVKRVVHYAYFAFISADRPQLNLPSGHFPC
jgi:hypothetical protein